ALNHLPSPHAHTGVMRIHTTAGFIALLALGVVTPSAAQRGTATLDLTVMDVSEGRLPGAVITITPAGGDAVSVTADELGRATASLPAGVADVRIEMRGFALYAGPVALEPGGNARGV